MAAAIFNVAVAHRDSELFDDDSDLYYTDSDYDEDDLLFHRRLGDVKQFHKHCSQCPFETDHTQIEEWWRRLRAEIHLTLDYPSYSWLSRISSVVIIVLIFVSTFAFCLETVPELEDLELWSILEVFVVIVFTIEYSLRFVVCAHKWEFFINFLNLIDLIAIVPFYVEQFAATGGEASTLRVFRVVRLARVFRLFKMSRYSSYMQIMGTALMKSRDACGLLLFFIGIAVIIFSSLMYYAERGSWDEARNTYIRGDGRPSPFTSIPTTFYWCIVTMATVGYGMVYIPVETAGMFIASLTMVCGILVIALPITILGSNFQDVYSVHKKKRAKKVHNVNHGLSEHVLSLQAQRKELYMTMNEIRATLSMLDRPTDFPQVNLFDSYFIDCFYLDIFVFSLSIFERPSPLFYVCPS